MAPNRLRLDIMQQGDIFFIMTIKPRCLTLPAMRFFAFIMSFYLLCVSFLPCGDRKECNSIGGAQSISASTNHQEHHHSAEACTPFCVCSCCASSACVQSNSKAHIMTIFPSEKHRDLNFFFLSRDFSSIWQPPRIV